MAIDENRAKHILAVARLMSKKAKDFGLDEKEMFTLGYLHDIGYEFGESEEHHIVGYKMLKQQEYKYANEVLHHGKPNTGYSSPALDLLNFADMKTNKLGEYVSFEERLEDIKTRRGESSPHYINSKAIIEDLKNKNFKDEV